MRILALDLGTKCGWAAAKKYTAIGLRQIDSGVWNLTPSKFDSIGMRYCKFEEYLMIELSLGAIDRVVYEAVRNHRAIDAAHVYGGLVAVLQTVCIKKGISYEGVPVGTIKKHATKSGNADKKAMVKAAIHKFKNINVIDDNHADALHLLDYVLSRLS